MLENGRAPDPLCRVLGRFRIQSRQEDHCADRTEDRLRAVPAVLFVELPDILVAERDTASTPATDAEGFAKIMERDVTGFIEREQHGSAVLVVARLSRDRGRETEQDREYDPVAGRVAFGDDDVDAGSRITQPVEIELPEAALMLFIRDRLHYRHRVRRTQRREFRPKADENSTLRFFPVRFFEDAPLNPRFGVRRFLHLMVDLVEAARG